MNNTKPIIKLETGFHNEKPIIMFRFNYNEALKSEVKKIKEATWSKSKQSWYIPKESFNLNQVFEHLKDISFIDYSALTQNSTPPINNTKKPKKNEQKQKPSIPPDYLNLLIQKRYADNTIKVYVNYFHDFTIYFKNKKLETITKEEINRYILELVTKYNISTSQQNQRINAIKFYYEKVLGRDKEHYNIERPRQKDTLPDALSKHEVQKLLHHTENLKHKSIIALIYSCGLRRSEVINLKIKDIDSNRMMIKIRGAKGNKDRYVQLSEGMLNLLREYYTEYKPSNWLFEGSKDGQYTATSVFKVIKRSAYKAGIKKNVYPHLLRHSYATHQLEQGIDIRFIQEWMGHDSIKTTERYTHVSEKNFKNFKNPLDDLL